MSIPESHASDFPKRRLAGWNSFAYNEMRVKTLTEHFDRKEGEYQNEKILAGHTAGRIGSGSRL